MLVAHVDDYVGDLRCDKQIYALDEGFSDAKDALRDTSLHVVRCPLDTPGLRRTGIALEYSIPTLNTLISHIK